MNKLTSTSSGNIKQKKIFTSILAVLVIVIIGFGIFLALKVMREPEATITQPAQTMGKISYTYYSVHPLLSLVPKPGEAMHVNSYGFRGDEIKVLKEPDTFRIFCLGGSTTYSGTLPYEDSYPAILQKMLQEKYPDKRIEVQNAACDWYSSEHSVVNYSIRVRRFQPDLIIVFHAINDLLYGFSPPWWTTGDYKPDYSHYLGPLIRTTKNPTDNITLTAAEIQSESADEVWDKLVTSEIVWQNLSVLKTKLPAVGVSNFRSFPTFENNLNLLIQLTRDDNCTLILCSQPFLYHQGLTAEEEQKLYYAVFHCAEDRHYPDLQSMISGMELFNSISLRTAQAHNVRYVDLAPAVPKNLTYFIDDVHMTKKGTSLVATSLFDYIVKSTLVRNQ
jgi:lysophospholipase L1-like esterase